MSNTTARTLTALPYAVYTAAYAGRPAPVVPAGQFTGQADYVRVEHDGEFYNLSLIVMPDGSIRRFATQYNGYGDSPNADERARSMRFACAWTPVEISPAPADETEPAVAPHYETQMQITSVRRGDRVRIDGKVKVVDSSNHDETSSNGVVFTRWLLVFADGTRHPAPHADKVTYTEAPVTHGRPAPAAVQPAACAECTLEAEASAHDNWIDAHDGQFPETAVELAAVKRDAAYYVEQGYTEHCD